MYSFGAELLAFIAPPDPGDKLVKVPVDDDFDATDVQIAGIDYGPMLLAQQEAARRILAESSPERVITFGGDCSVSQIPFDYLSGKYGNSLGILWLDAHPDVSTPLNSHHLHEMPLGNLLGLSPDTALTHVSHPVSPSHVFMAGLIVDELLPKEQVVHELHLRTAGPEAVADQASGILEWLRAENIRHLAVHWDLDVLSPYEFRSLLTSAPGVDPDSLGFAVGRLRISDVTALILEAAAEADIVGLSVTEHIPWDARNLRAGFAKLPIFRS